MKTEICRLLDQLSIQYERYDHVAVYTSEQARCLISSLPGASTKNLFLRDKKGKRYFLLIFDDLKSVDLKSLALRIGVTRLSLASPARLMEILGVEPGAVSLLALINDPDHKVNVLMDQDIWESDAIQCHPLINTSTFVISMKDIKRYLETTGHTVTRINI